MYKIIATNPNQLDKYGVARRTVSTAKTIEGAELKRAVREAEGWDVEIQLPTSRVNVMELEPGQVFLAADGQQWAVVETLPVVNKRGQNVTATSTDRGGRQRGSFSFNGGESVEVIVGRRSL